MENILNYMLKVGILFSMIACAGMQKQHLQYNIVGQVFEQKYNTMPQVGTDSKKGSPLITTIYIYGPTKTSQLDGLNASFCSHINGPLIDSFVSDSFGKFNAHLKSGKYSVFVRYENAYYIPYFSGADWATIIEVNDNNPTQLELLVRSSSNFQ